MDGLSIRMAQIPDAQKLLEIYAPYVTGTAVTFEYEVPTVAEFAARIEKVLKRYPWIIGEQAGEIIGYAYASPFKERAAYDWAAETSIYLRPDMRGRGFGRKLHDALENLLKTQNICNMEACIASPIGEDPYLTDGSIRFHESLGYRMAGKFEKCGYKFGRWYDMVWMERIIGEHRQKQPDMIPIGEINK